MKDVETRGRPVVSQVVKKGHDNRERLALFQ